MRNIYRSLSWDMKYLLYLLLLSLSFLLVFWKFCTTCFNHIFPLPWNTPSNCTIPYAPNFVFALFFFFWDTWLSSGTWSTYQGLHPWRKLTLSIPQLWIVKNSSARPESFSGLILHRSCVWTIIVSSYVQLPSCI